MVEQQKTRARGALLIATMLVVTIVGGLIVAGTAGAKTPKDPYSSPSDSVHPTRITTPPPRTHSVVPPDDQVLGKRPPSVVPFTGADVTLFVITGVAAIATGAVLVRRTRARRNNS